MIYLWIFLGAVVFAGLASLELLLPPEIKPDDSPRPLCACSRRGPASMNLGRP